MTNNAIVALIAISGALDLEFDQEPTPATTLTTVVPCQAGWKVGIGEATWQDTIGNALIDYVCKLGSITTLTNIYQ